MKGFPKWLNTRGDFEYAMANFPAEQWKPKLQELLDTAYGWFYISELAENETGITDDTHKIGVMEDGKRLQYEWKINQTCRLYRLGFTLTEVRNLVK